MSEIPRITPVRIKDEVIREDLINPGSFGHSFPQGVGPRVVYLDERYDHPEQQRGDDAQAERERQTSMWQQFKQGPNWVTFLDRRIEEDAQKSKDDLRRLQTAEHEAFAALKTRQTAEFFERVFSHFFEEEMNVVIISTGVRPFDGNNYHDIGYLRSQ